MSARIMFAFEHVACSIAVDVHAPLGPDLGDVGLDPAVNRLRPTCPICKEPMSYAGFRLGPTNVDDPLRVLGAP